MHGIIVISQMTAYRNYSKTFLFFFASFIHLPRFILRLLFGSSPLFSLFQFSLYLDVKLHHTEPIICIPGVLQKNSVVAFTTYDNSIIVRRIIVLILIVVVAVNDLIVPHFKKVFVYFCFESNLS